MKTTLVNYRTHNTHPARSTFISIDRRSIFGNPFPITKTCTREQCIKLYKYWFNEMIETSPSFKDEVKKLKGKTLICWCTPLPCHGNVIIEYLESEI